MLTHICLFLFVLLLLTRSFTMSIVEITATTEAILELPLKILGWVMIPTPYFHPNLSAGFHRWSRILQFPRSPAEVDHESILKQICYCRINEKAQGEKIPRTFLEGHCTNPLI